MMKKLLILAVLVVAASCGGPTSRMAMTQLPSDLELRPLVSSVMIRTISLPNYAASDDISFETAGGMIGTTGVLWADNPERAITLILARTIGDILNTNVGPDPWPFSGVPDVAVDIRVERMLAGADGNFQLIGQFFVSGQGIDFRDRARLFDISTLMAGNSAAQISDAQAAALVALSEQIAQVLGR